MTPSLDSGHGIEQPFVLGWRFTDQAAERWTQRFNLVKAGDARAIRAAAILMYTLLPPNPPWGAHNTVGVIGVPGSSDTQLDLDKPVGKLSRFIAKRWNGVFLPD